MQQRPTVSEIVASYPGPIELVPPVRRWRIMLGFNLAVIAAGLLMIAQGHRNGIYVVVAFGLLALPLAIVALPGSAKLRIERDGFTATALYRGSLTRWTDVSEFQVARMARSNQLILVYDDKSLVGGSHLLAGSRYAGRNSALPSSYGLNAEQLAYVLNHWRSRALEGTGAPVPETAAHE